MTRNKLLALTKQANQARRQLWLLLLTSVAKHMLCLGLKFMTIVLDQTRLSPPSYLLQPARLLKMDQ